MKNGSKSSGKGYGKGYGKGSTPSHGYGTTPGGGAAKPRKPAGKTRR